MLLRISHRLLLMNVLPQESDYATLRIVRELQSALSFTEEELKATGLTLKDDVFDWSPDYLDEPVEISIGEKASDVIRSGLEMANSRKKLGMKFLPLYEHFVGGEEWSP